jgi:hypothetical protein
MMMRENRLFWFSLIMLLFGAGMAGAAETPEYACFLQKSESGGTLYLAKDGSAATAVVTGKQLQVYFTSGSLLYIDDQNQLFSYRPGMNAARLIVKFDAPEVYLEELPGSSGQMLAAVRSNYQIQWHILELSDGSLRKVKLPQPSTRGPSKQINNFSPDHQLKAVVSRNTYGSRFDLTLTKQQDGRETEVWHLPETMTVMPELPVWAPNSRYFAFYAKLEKGYEGYYSLYVLDTQSLKLNEVEEKVFYISFVLDDFRASGYRPDWSPDSRYLLYAFQPSGNPLRSVIIKYRVENRVKTFLVDSPGSNQFPAWSPSGRSVLFLSGPDRLNAQAYIIESAAGGLRRISPESGVTVWARWYQP